MLSTHLCLNWCEAEKADDPLVMNTEATKRFVWSECFIIFLNKNNIRCWICKKKKTNKQKHKMNKSKGGKEA